MQPKTRPFPELSDAWADPHPASRLRKLRRGGEAVRQKLLAEGPVEGIVTCPLATVVYPSNFAFSGAALSPAPFILFTNRMNVIQFREEGELRTLLFNPTDYIGSENVPFYKKLRQRYGELPSKLLYKKHGEVPVQLERLGLRPEDIDYIAFDHLHVQELRKWLGTASPIFPRAKLLVERHEWESVKDLHPYETVWYVPGGCEIPEERVQVVDGDVHLGRGLAILWTPGHTMGNWSLAVTTADGVFVTSENGVATESYSPEHSNIPGVRSAAATLELEVVLNGNTRESTLDQYSSMVLEKTVAGPSKKDPRFCNFVPSSELTASIMAPGLSPTFSHGPISHGTLKRPSARREAA